MPGFTCVDCNNPAQMFWIKQVVWDQTRRAADLPEGHGYILCIACTEKRLGRELTIHDLDLATYKRNLNFNSADFVKECARATVHGACQETAVQTPQGWQVRSDMPFSDAFYVGAKLAHQTPGAGQFVPNLILEFQSQFP
jgi:hypothetical protein